MPDSKERVPFFGWSKLFRAKKSTQLSPIITSLQLTLRIFKQSKKKPQKISEGRGSEKSVEK